MVCPFRRGRVRTPPLPRPSHVPRGTYVRALSVEVATKLKPAVRALEVKMPRGLGHGSWKYRVGLAISKNRPSVDATERRLL